MKHVDINIINKASIDSDKLCSCLASQFNAGDLIEFISELEYRAGYTDVLFQLTVNFINEILILDDNNKEKLVSYIEGNLNEEQLIEYLNINLEGE